MAFHNNKSFRVAAASSAIVLMASLGACNKFHSADKFVADAKAYQQKGDTKSAVIQLKNALQKDPNNVDARLMLGNIYADSGDGPSAEKELRKAISLGLAKDKVTLPLAKSLLEQAQFQKMLDETAPAGDAKLGADLLTLRGNAFAGLQKFDEAKQSFEQALTAQPDFPGALIGLSKLAIGQNDMENAFRLAEQATAKNPKSAEAWQFKGDLLRIRQEYEPALAAYGEAVKLKPDDASSLIVRANLEIGMKKFAEAQKDVDAANKVSSGALLVQYTQALLQYTQGKNKEALDSLQQVLHAAPQYLPALLLNGSVQYALGSTQQAQSDLAKYLEANPGSGYARKLLAASMLQNGQAQRALETLEPMLSGPASKDNQLYALAGDAATRVKDFNKATEYYEAASKLAPENANYRTALGLSELNAGATGRAISELEKASSLDEKSPRAGVLLAMTYVRQQEYDKALAVVAGLEKQQANNPMLQNLKGAIYLSKKDAANARASFEKAVALQPTYFAAVANLARLDAQENKPDSAKKRFEALLEKDKKNLQAMLALGSLALNQGKKDEARQWLEKAIADHPDSTLATQALAAFYVGAGEKQKALTLAKKLSATDPKNPDYLTLLAQTEQAVGDKDGMVDSYSKLAAVQPESAQVQFKLALAYMSSGNDSAALESLKTTLRLDPKMIDAQGAMAGIEARRGNYDHALEMARAVQKQDAKAPAGYVMEGDILMMQKKPSLAAKQYETAYGLAKRGPILIKLHQAMTQDGKAKEADAKLTQWVKDNPNDIATRMYLALHLLGSDKGRAAAIEHFQAILKADPQNVVALNNLAWAYDQDKNPHALEYAEKAYQLAADNPEILDTYGWLLTQKGEFNRSLPMLQRAASLISGDGENASTVRYHLAYTLLKSGDKDKARKELQQLVAGKNFPNMEDAKSLLRQL